MPPNLTLENKEIVKGGEKAVTRRERPATRNLLGDDWEKELSILFFLK